eukprot:TRINITY_DN57134_c0_g1_i1.p1 TRINITY_DN57134_c0_g1~~TRINITY_DN57134_c0_g1_i1.p1  ORF type:complete len:406 (-),score=82.89 TRINITY_DN57134_c0_g1_i1:44-1228(-)
MYSSLHERQQTYGSGFRSASGPRTGLGSGLGSSRPSNSGWAGSLGLGSGGVPPPSFGGSSAASRGLGAESLGSSWASSSLSGGASARSHTLGGQAGRFNLRGGAAKSPPPAVPPPPNFLHANGPSDAQQQRRMYPGAGSHYGIAPNDSSATPSFPSRWRGGSSRSASVGTPGVDDGHLSETRSSLHGYGQGHESGFDHFRGADAHRCPARQVPPVPGISAAMAAEEASAAAGAAQLGSGCPSGRGAALPHSRAAAPVHSQHAPVHAHHTQEGDGSAQPPRSLDRRLSSRSAHMMAQLAGFEQQLMELDRSVGAVEAGLTSQQLLAGQARDHLAQIEAQLDKLQCNGVDSIDTFELQSGKAEARSLRKQLTRRSEMLHERIEVIFRFIKEQLNQK